MSHFGRPGGPNEIEAFREDLSDNIELVREHCDELDDPEDCKFAKQLIEFWDTKEYLTDAQCSYMVRYWREIQELVGTG